MGMQGGLEGGGQLAVAAPDRGQTCRWGREAGRAGGEGQRLRSYFLSEAGSYRLILWTRPSWSALFAASATARRPVLNFRLLCQWTAFQNRPRCVP